MTDFVKTHHLNYHLALSYIYIYICLYFTSFPYGIIARQKKTKVPYNKDTFKEKSRFALALISHCKTQSKREKIVSALKKYIPLDEIGHCGGKSFNKTEKLCFSSYNEKCMNNVISKYKFYFSFENSLCRDYITEKAYRPLNLSVIPVVYGGANYSHFLPSKSYINVKDFKTVRDLAEYLLQLARDSEKYLEYFKWKEDYRQILDIKWIINPKKARVFKVDPGIMCNLCEYLHTSSKSRKVIKHLKNLWGMKENCVNPDKWQKSFLS